METLGTELTPQTTGSVMVWLSPGWRSGLQFRGRPWRSAAS